MNNHAQFIKDLVFTCCNQAWTGAAISNDLGTIANHVFRNPADAMTDYILSELTGEISDPVVSIGKEGLSVAFPPQIIAVIAFHMDRCPSQVAVPYQTSHRSRGMGELIIVTHSELTFLCFRQA